MIRRLLLWDIDGTLVRTGEVGAAIFDVALEAVVGRRPLFRVHMSGKTDPQIVGEYLSRMELPRTDEVVGAVLRVAEKELAAAARRGEVAAGGAACVGVGALLAVLARDDRVISTLLTGNIKPNALVKVAAFGLDGWFDPSLGAYGSDATDRNLLVPIALGRLAAEKGVLLDPAEAWVIGDTPAIWSAPDRAASGACWWRAAAIASTSWRGSGPRPCSPIWVTPTRSSSC